MKDYKSVGFLLNFEKCQSPYWRLSGDFSSYCLTSRPTQIAARVLKVCFHGALRLDFMGTEYQGRTDVRWRSGQETI